MLHLHCKLTNERNLKIDYLKGISCLLVVINHFHHSGFLGSIEYTISHIGVPIFFLTSGYFLYPDVRKLPLKIIHIAKLTGIHLFLYIFLEWQRISSAMNSLFSFYVLKDLLSSIFTISNIKYTIFFSTSLFGGGQWFLWALLEAYILFWIIYKLDFGDFFEKKAFECATFLLTIHIVLRFVLVNIFNITQFSILDFTQTYSVRNVWLDAIPFMLIGIAFKKNEIKQYPILFLRTGLFIGIFISIIETFFIRTKANYAVVLYIGTIVAVIFAFLEAVIYPKINLNNYIIKIIYYIGNKLSMIIYFIHPIVGDKLYPIISKYDKIHPFWFPIIILLSSILLSYLIYNTLVFLKGKINGIRPISPRL